MSTPRPITPFVAELRKRGVRGGFEIYTSKARSRHLVDAGQTIRCHDGTVYKVNINGSLRKEKP